MEDERRNFSRGEIVVIPTTYNEIMKRTAKYRMYPNKKSISDASWGTLFFMLDYKAEGAGGLVERVDPGGTSQTC
ncbi:MAG: transposase, partial [Actinobacteria bacterium]|nr:transposase [Actinomycetota bacterium]